MGGERNGGRDIEFQEGVDAGGEQSDVAPRHGTSTCKVVVPPDEVANDEACDSDGAALDEAEEEEELMGDVLGAGWGVHLALL